MAFFQKIDRTVRRETGYIAVCTGLLSLVMEAVFLIIRKWTAGVLLGNLLGGCAAVLNFFLMGITVQKALDRSEEDAAKTVKISQSLRMVMLFAVAALGVALPVFNPVSSLLPLLFPRIAIALRPRTRYGREDGGGDGP